MRLAGKVNPKVVSEMLGRSMVTPTLDVYSHAPLDMRQDAAATLEMLLSPCQLVDAVERQQWTHIAAVFAASGDIKQSSDT